MPPRRPLALILVVIAAIALLPGNQIAEASALRQLTRQDQDEIARTVEALSTREKVGQLLMVGFVGDSQSLAHVDRLVSEYYVGNVILFEHNIRNLKSERIAIDDWSIPTQVADLTNALQEMASRTRHSLPLLIAADQEHGSALVVEKGITHFPGAMGLAATGDPVCAMDAGRITALELRAMGIHMNLAPVADINTNQRNDVIADRAFAASGQIVENFATAYMNGLQEGGALSVGKHVPGHGDTSWNPHYGLPISGHSETQVRDVMLRPFRSLVNEGIDGLMTGHVAFPKLSLEATDQPFSISRIGIERWIRGELDFNGAILTDDLVGMAAIHNEHRSPTDSGLTALKAGADILILSGVPYSQVHSSGHLLVFGFQELENLIDSAVAYFESSREAMESLNASVVRVLRLKKRIDSRLSASAWQVDKGHGLDAVRSASSLARAQEIADRSITLVHDGAGLFTEDSGPLQRLRSTDPILLLPPVFRVDDLSPLISERFKNVATIELGYSKRWTEEALNEVCQRIDSQLSTDPPRIIIIGLVSADHVAVLDHILQAMKKSRLNCPVLAIAFRVPNMLEREIGEITYLAAYSNLRISNEAVSRILFGDVAPGDIERLPVSVAGWFQLVERPKVVEQQPLGRSEDELRPNRTSDANLTTDSRWSDPAVLVVLIGAIVAAVGTIIGAIFAQRRSG